MNQEPIATLAHVIQLSVAPVFLLTGIAGLLNVLAGRLARVIDRARHIERALHDGVPGEVATASDRLRTLATRARWINVAISLCVASAIFVALVVVTLFVGAFWRLDYDGAVAGLFIAAMLALVGGLVYFMREIYLATSSLRIGAQ
jgi:hypothetical protein